MHLKINQIVNLQDARCCAAWGIEFVSFALEKGALHRISEPMLQEISSWLSGVNVVLDYGVDLEAGHHAPNLGVPTYLQIDSQALELQPQTYTLPTIYTLHLPTKLPKNFWERYHFATDGAQLVEVIAPQTYLLQEWEQTFKELALQTLPTIFNLDTIPLDFFLNNHLAPFGFSARTCVSMDFANLDYDACEKLLETLNKG